MKKIMFIVMAVALMLTGCGAKETQVADVPVNDIVKAIKEKAAMAEPVDEVNFKENTDIATMLNISPDDLAEGVYVKAMINIKADELIVLKAADDSKIETLKKALEDEGAAQEQNWSTYLPEQYELVKNRLIKQEGPYLILFVGEKKDVAEETFDSMLAAK